MSARMTSAKKGAWVVGGMMILRRDLALRQGRARGRWCLYMDTPKQTLSFPLSHFPPPVPKPGPQTHHPDPDANRADDRPPPLHHLPLRLSARIIAVPAVRAHAVRRWSRQDAKEEPSEGDEGAVGRKEGVDGSVEGLRGRTVRDVGGDKRGGYPMRGKRVHGHGTSVPVKTHLALLALLHVKHHHGLARFILLCLVLLF